jgi:DNA-binding LacI/PurR family transcriptional regulator
MTLLFRHNEHPAFTGDVVDSDGAAGVYKLAEHLIAHGHSRIGLVAGPLHTSTGRDRYHGFLQALSDHEIVTDPELLYFGDFSSASGFEGTKQLLSMHAPPTALLCLSNTIAIGSMQFLRHANIQVPRDVSFVTFGEIEHVDLMWLNPTRIPQNPTLIGKKVGQLILDRIEHPDKANHEIIFASEIIEGDSVRDISQAE